ncbi:MAG TPA: PQQ-binding-like beta-propeller repeat protein [Candidatus Limnocylindria bacterium]|jgi:outer membrane protein assembly factor BamB|nr:PQQ-binding-like beta-propeller repeat protein [Candidatus Limnocylindria bacterium]
MNILRHKWFSSTLSPQMPRELPAGFVRWVAFVIGVLPAIAGLAQEPGAKKWDFTTGGPVNSSPALSANGLLYVGSGDSNVYALNVQTGTQQWKFTTGGAVGSSPAIGADGSVYVGSTDAKVYCLDGATGNKKWEFLTGRMVATSPAVGYDGTIYVGSHDGKVYALDGATGIKRWEFAATRPFQSSPIVFGDELYIGCDDGHLYQINTTTGVKSSEYIAGTSIRSSPAFIIDYLELIPSEIFVGSIDRKLYCLDGGNVGKRWEFATDGRVMSSPAIALSGLLCFGSDDGKVYAVERERGGKRWEFSTGGPVSSSPAVGLDNLVYVGSQDGKIYALNGSTGSKQWSFDTGGPVTSSPAIGPDGTLYVGSQDGKIYALTTSSRGVGVTRWPMFRQNAKHTTVIETSSRLKWGYNTPYGKPLPPIIGGDGSLIVGTDTGNLSSLHPQSGVSRWDRMFEQGVQSPPRIGLNGSIYIGSAGVVHSLDPDTGLTQWTFGTNQAVDVAGVGGDGSIQVRGADSKVYALDARNGLPIWNFAPSNGWNLKSISTNHIACFMDGAEIVQIVNTRTGERLAHFPTGLTNIFSVLLRPDGVVHISSEHIMADFDVGTGQRKWTASGCGTFWSFEPAFATDGTLYAGNSQYPGGYCDAVYALDPETGVTKWKYDSANIILGTPRVGADGVVYVYGWDGNVCALDPGTGLPIWGFFAGGRLQSAVLGSDGTLYVSGLYDGVIALATGQYSPSRLSIVPAAPGLPKVRLTLHVAVGRKYQLQRSPNLTNWTNSEDPFVATSSQADRDVDTTVEAGFWRLVEVAP